jgi:ankyrin repeat protein
MSQVNPPHVISFMSEGQLEKLEHLAHHFRFQLECCKSQVMPSAQLAVFPGGLQAVLRLTPLGPRVAALSHVVELASTMVGTPSRWTLDAAIDLGLWTLADRFVASLEQDESLIALEKQARARRAMTAASRTGTVDLMQRLLDTFQCHLDETMVAAAARGGQLSAVRWLHEHLQPLSELETRRFFSSDVMVLAAESGNFAMVQWLHTLSTDGVCASFEPVVAASTHGHLGIVEELIGYCSSPLTVDAMDGAATMGHLDIVRFLHAYGENASTPSACCSTLAMDQAATNGHLHVVEWLHANRSEGCTTAAMDGAAEHGYSDVVRFLHENRMEGCTWRAMDAAARGGHLEIVRFLHEHRLEGCTTDAMTWAVGNNDFDMVMFLDANRVEGCACDAMDCAAGRGHLEMVKWLHANRSEGCTAEAMDAAASNGHLDVVKFLHSHRDEGCTISAVDGAAEHGYLNVVKWLYENRDDDLGHWTLYPMKYAVRNGHLEVVKWLHSNCDADYDWDLINDAARSGHLSILQFLHEVDLDLDGFCTKEAMVEAAANGHLKVVKWLHKNWGDDCTTAVLTRAASYGHHDMAEWLFAHTYEGYFAYAFDHVASNGDLAMLELLHENIEMEVCQDFELTVGIPQGGFQDPDDDPWEWGQVGDETFRRAIVGNHIEVVQWLCEKFQDLVDVDKLRDQAESQQRWGISRWLEGQRDAAISAATGTSDRT